MKRLVAWLLALVVALSSVPAQAGWVGWTTGDPLASQGSVDKKFCYLMGVSGDLTAPGVSVFVREQNGEWIIGGTSGNPAKHSLSMLARCESRDGYFGGKPNYVRWLSPPIVAGPTAANACAIVKSGAAWWGDAWTALTAISGTWTKKAQAVAVVQNSDPKLSSRVSVRSCTAGLAATAYSAFVGVPHSGQPLTFVGPGGKGSADVAGEWIGAPGKTVTMAPAFATECYLTGISGTVTGPVDFGIDLASGFGWQLRQSSAPGLTVRARCIAML